MSAACHYVPETKGFSDGERKPGRISISLKLKDLADSAMARALEKKGIKNERKIL
jgi:hypothetical protein